MVTPGIIKYVYWLLLFFTIASGILRMLMSPITLVILILMLNIYQQLKKNCRQCPH